MTKYLKTFSLTVLLLAGCLSLSAQATLQRLEEDITRGGGIYHSYEFYEIDDVKAPKGFKPFYISHYGRHGSRYHYTYDYLGTLDKELHRADSLGNLTPEGELLLSQVDSILAGHKDMLGNVTYKGQQEIKRLARRMSSRFPEVFNDKDRNLIDAYSSIVRRCVVSMAAACSELSKCNPNLDVRFTSDDVVFHGYINVGHHTREGKAYYTPLMNEELKKADWSVVSSRIFINPALAQGSSFDHADNLWNYWAVCQCLDTPVHIDILKYFTKDLLLYHWKIKSGYWYLINVRSDVFGEKCAEGMAPLVRDFIAKADEAIAGNPVAATLRYGHDSTLMPFAAALGLEDFSRTHSVDDLPVQYWDYASMIGMCSNVQIVFYRNRKGEVIVKFLYNERETTVPALTPAYGKYFYSWDSLRKYYTEKLK